MKHILITGVAGLIGSQFAKWILAHKKNVRIYGIDNLSGGNQEFIPKEVIFIKHELTDQSIDVLFKNIRIDEVYHFAAYAAEGLSPFIRKFNYSNNLVATANVVNFCINTGVKRLIFTSSMAVYGKLKTPFKEEMVPHPIDPYGVAKYACEMDIRIAQEQHGLEYCILRPHNVYGIGQNIWDRYRNVLGIWMYQKINGEPFTIYGKGKQKRAFTYIEDILGVLWECGCSKNAQNQIFNIGSTDEITILEAAQLLSEIVGGNETSFLGERHEVPDAYSDHTKITQTLGFNNQTKLKEGLSIMWEWANKLQKKEQVKWKNYEIDRGMYKFWK